MTSNLLYEHHRQRNQRAEKRRFLLFLAAQFMQYGMVLLFLLGGLFFVVLGIRVLL